MYKCLKWGQPPVKPESSVCKHPEDHNNVLSGIVPVGDTFHSHQLILLEWCLDM